MSVYCEVCTVCKLSRTHILQMCRRWIYLSAAALLLVVLVLLPVWMVFVRLRVCVFVRIRERVWKYTFIRTQGKVTRLNGSLYYTQQRTHTHNLFAGCCSAVCVRTTWRIYFLSSTWLSRLTMEHVYEWIFQLDWVRSRWAACTYDVRVECQHFERDFISISVVPSA